MKEYNICIIGLGYVGLPLAAEFGKKYNTLGFDIDTNRINELREGIDRTLEISSDALKSSARLTFTANRDDIKNSNIYVVTVPTPVDKHNRPDLTPLKRASETVGSALKKGDIVIYESTVFPGTTEEECVPVLEAVSKLKFNTDFYVGYSPERINPGDKEHTLTKILKVTSGSTIEVAEEINNLYASIITAGTYKASSIKVAEAAKVIENTQRDLNIAFVNELAKIFNLLNIDTREVLAAAGTKWNFLKFFPGLVGGHCIGVDPYYLAQKAQEVGYHPEIILAGRRINDGMGIYIADQVVKLMVRKDIAVKGASALILGFTFKENCPDVRNTRVIDIIKELNLYNFKLDVVDPWADADEVAKEYGINISNGADPARKYDAIILAVAHNAFAQIDIKQLGKKDCIIYDVKGALPADIVDARL